MKRILEGPSRRVATIFNEVDINFIEVGNSILKIAYPDYNLRDYAEPDNDPPAPVSGDCYLVKEAGTIRDTEVVKNDILHFNGTDWELLPYRITEINAAFQSQYFNAGNIAFASPAGLVSDNVQSALEEITGLLVNAGILIP